MLTRVKEIHGRYIFEFLLAGQAKRSDTSKII